MLILIAIIGLSVLILIHELGHFLTAKFFGVKVEEFGIGFPPRLLSKKIGETIYSINLLPFGGFVKIFGEDGGKETTTSSPSAGVRFGDKPIWQRSVMVLAGILMNVLLGWLVLSVVFMLGVPEHLAIVDIAPDSPASAVNIQRGDILLAANYQEVVLQDPIKSEEFINLVNQAGENPVLLKIKQGNDVFETSISGRLNPPAGQGSLGVALVNVGFPAEPFFKSIFSGAVATFATLGAIIAAFFDFFAAIFVSREVLEAVAGPVGIFVIASQVGSLGIAYFLQFMALISLNLAILNLIPFPALDGGRFLFLLIERIKGSPVSVRLQMAVNSVGFAALVVLMVLVTVRDIGRLVN